MHEHGRDGPYAGPPLLLLSIRCFYDVRCLIVSQIPIDPFKNAEVNVYNLWRKMLDEQEKIAGTRLQNAKTLHDEVQINYDNYSYSIIRNFIINIT